MKINFNTLLFSMTMIWGVILSLSSNSWMMIWIGLEISLMSIMPMMSNKKLLSSESSMKYFIIQSISASLMMWGMLLMMINSEIKFQAMLTTSIMIKVGVVPFHNWILEITEGLDLMVMFLLFTIMKIAPMNMISYLSMKTNLFSMISMIVSSIMGINQNSLRKILAYSSIYNMGFMLMVTNLNSIWITFLIMYSTMLMMTILMMNKMKSFYINQMMVNEKNLITKMNIWILMMSMGGLPPMIGFMAKLMVIQTIIENNEMIISLVMILTSMTTMFFYMRTSFVSIMFSTTLMKWQKMKMSKQTNLMMIINLLVMPMVLTMKSFI